jgi:hypothetical protein
MNLPPLVCTFFPVRRPAPEMAMKASQGAIRLLVHWSKARVFQEFIFEEMVAG